MRAKKRHLVTVKLMLSHWARSSTRPWGSGLSPRRLRRGATLLVTVLLSAVAASIVLVILTQTLNSAKNEQERASADAAGRKVEDVRLAVEHSLAEDPAYFLNNVSSQERSRVCEADGGRIISSGSPWPTECGATWVYDKNSTPLTENIVLEVQPPNPDNSLMNINIIASVGSATVGTHSEYRLDDAGRYSIWSSADLTINELQEGTGQTSLSGSIYSAGTVFLSESNRVTIENAQVITEKPIFAGPRTGTTVRFYASETTEEAPPVRDVRDITPMKLNTSALAAGVTNLTDVSCAPKAALLPDGYISKLCLAPSQSLTRTDGSIVSAPGNASKYLLLFGESGDPETVNIYYAGTPGTYERECGAGCDLAAASVPQVAAGTHPGAKGHWDGFLGTFPLPATGVISADKDVHVGLCGESFLTRDSACETISGASPGMAIERSVTVLAGSASNPKSVYVAGPINAEGSAKLGLVATGDIILPYWAKAAGTPLNVDASLVSLGLGAGKDSASISSIYTLPRSVGPSLGNPNYGSMLTVTGSLVAPKVDLNMGLFDSLTIQGDTNMMRTPPPYLPGFTGKWDTAKVRSLTIEEISSLL